MPTHDIPPLHDPGNDHAIDELFVFMSIDDQGRHGILGGMMAGMGSIPLITGEAKIVEMMKPIAESVAKRSGKNVGLFKFKRDELIWETKGDAK